MKKSYDDPEVWMWVGKWALILFLIYQFWSYIVLILALIGGVYVWNEWRKKDLH